MGDAFARWTRRRTEVLGFSFTAGPDIKRTIAPEMLDRVQAATPGQHAQGKGPDEDDNNGELGSD